MTTDPAAFYRLFRKHYGSQGWWPLINAATGESTYGIINKASDSEIFEISIGAILTQAVAWKNVEKALYNLKKSGLLDPVKLSNAPVEIIAEKVKPSGYFNQKAVKIKNFLAWFEKFNFSSDQIAKYKTEDITEPKGIIEETTSGGSIIYKAGQESKEVKWGNLFGSALAEALISKGIDIPKKPTTATAPSSTPPATT